MKNKKLIIIETSDIGARYTAQAVLRLGFEPVFLVNLKNYQGDTLEQIQECEHYSVDTTNPQAMASFVQNQGWDVEAVTTFLDSRLHLAIQLAKLLNVTGLDPRLMPFKDKGRVYDLGPQFSPPSVCFGLDDIPITKIEDLRRKFPRVILKPRCTAGGIGARVFSTDNSFPDLLAHLRSSEIPSHLQPNEWMLQAFVTGELVSAEGFVRDGEIHLIGFTGRRKIGNTESWSGFPYDSQIRPVALNRATEQVTGLLQASKVQNGFFHIELIVNDTEAYVIDANLGRMGGGGIGEILASAYGVDPVDIFLEVLKISLFPNSQHASFWTKTPTFAVSINYGLEKEATLSKPETANTTKDVYITEILSEGALVPAMGSDNWAWVGIVSGSAEAVRNHLNALRVSSTTGLYTAYFADAEVTL